MNYKKKHHILIVDDEQGILNLYKTYLQDSQYQVETATTYRRACELIRNNKFDLVITDLHLTIASENEGLNIAKLTKSLYPDSKVMLITGYGTPELVEKIQEFKISYYLEKPFNCKELPVIVNRLLTTSKPPAGRIYKYLSSRASRNLIKFTQILLDTIVLITSFWISYLLRFEFNLESDQIPTILLQTPLVLTIQYCALVVTGVYSFVWRYIGFREIKTFYFASLISFIPIIILRFFLPATLGTYKVPISISILTTILGFGGLLLARILRRGFYEMQQKRHLQSLHCKEMANGNGKTKSKSSKKQVLLIGAGQAGVLSAKEIQKRGDMDIKIAGFIDDDHSKLGLVVNGIKVIGNTEELPQLVPELEIDHVIITISHATRMDIARIVTICESIPVKVRIVPGLFELLDGKVEVNRIRDVDIEDLLGREKVNLELEVVSQFLEDKCIMITGAGGSIGSELVRQVIKFQPAKVLMVERCEFALYQIKKEICQTDGSDICMAIIADISDEDRMNSIFKKYQPKVILHAAAHKHVPLMEYNPTEAIKNNSLATWKLANLAGKNQTDVFVLISTDKAVNPTSIMGASKRIAELFIQGLNGQYSTRYLAVRFGNVLGSTGSVIPLFREQIRKGGPVTVTHPDMTRYFMTIPEAAQLVLQASTMGKGAEIYILDMGEPVKIVDLAESMIKLSGLKPHEDILVKYTGLRPGEKLFEELSTSDDVVDKTRHPKIFIVKINEFESEKVNQVLNQLNNLSSNGFESELRSYISDLIPESTLNSETLI